MATTATMSPSVIDETWKLKAACRGMDPNLFFPERGYGVDQMAAIRTVCDTCPVSSNCDQYAEQRVEVVAAEGARAYRVAGVWAGISEKERKKRRRARAFKSVKTA